MISPHNLEEWKKDCMKWMGRELENTVFAHWCNDWDDLPINETCDEFQYCGCYDEEVTDGPSEDSKDDFGE